MKCALLVFSLLVFACLATPSWSGQQIVRDEFTFTSSFDGTGPLYATAVYQEGARKQPMMVVQHGYGGKRKDVYFSAERMAARGYYCICIDTRGRGESAGTRDDGGIEIMDLYDGILSAIKRYAGRIDGSRISIVGYSNGGGQVFFAIVRFPFMFWAGLAFFGITDYGMWGRMMPKQPFPTWIAEVVGGTPRQVPDKYTARSAVLAARNLSGTRLHIAYGEEESVCPIPMDTAFVNAASKAGCKDVFLHVSKKGDRDRWFHGHNDGHLSPMEDHFVDDIRKSKSTRPQMPRTGELVVIGFLITPKFRCTLGNGDDAAAIVRYNFGVGNATFDLAPLSSDTHTRARIDLLKPLEFDDVELWVDGRKKDCIVDDAAARAEATITSRVEFHSADEPGRIK
jgi:dienelactone hydrolase